MQLRDWLLSDHAGVLGRLEQGVVAHVPPDRWYEQADGGGSSIAALVYHLSRHQDLAVHVVVRRGTAVWNAWRGELGVADISPTAGLSESEDRAVTARLPVDVLLGYARAVHEATQAWLTSVDPAALGAALAEVAPTRTLLEGAGVAGADVPWLHAMWGDRPGAWLLQWPGIGHGHAHVGEATSVRNRLGLSPF